MMGTKTVSSRLEALRYSAYMAYSPFRFLFSLLFLIRFLKK